MTMIPKTGEVSFIVTARTVEPPPNWVDDVEQILRREVEFCLGNATVSRQAPIDVLDRINRADQSCGVLPGTSRWEFFQENSLLALKWVHVLLGEEDDDG